MQNRKPALRQAPHVRLSRRRRPQPTGTNRVDGQPRLRHGDCTVVATAAIRPAYAGIGLPAGPGGPKARIKDSIVAMVATMVASTLRAVHAERRQRGVGVRTAHEVAHERRRAAEGHSGAPPRGGALIGPAGAFGRVETARSDEHGERERIDPVRRRGEDDGEGAVRRKFGDVDEQADAAETGGQKMQRCDRQPVQPGGDVRLRWRSRHVVCFVRAGLELPSLTGAIAY